MVLDLPELTEGQMLQLLEKLEAEDSLVSFMRQGWKYIDPQPYVDSWHIHAVAEHLEAVTKGQIKRLLINVPPRSSKSSLCSVGWPAWTWVQQRKSPLTGPEVQFMSTSYASTLSERDSTKMRRLIESEWYKRNWGDRFKLTGDQNTKRKFENSKGGYRLATSLTGTQTGDGGVCHPKGTKILTDSGYVPIEELKLGEKVLSYDLETKELVYSEILAMSVRQASGILEIRTHGGDSVRSTPEHPFYTDNGYRQAQSLKMGDVLRVFRNGLISDTVQIISRLEDEFQPVYDIQVARTNNFFAEGILVHNCLLIDDASSANDANSEVERQNVIRWWTETMPTRLNDPIDGAIVVIMQRLHEEDLAGYILEHDEGGDWTHLMIPMRYDSDRHCKTIIGWEDPRTENGELLCPQRYDEKTVSDLERNLGAYAAASQLQQIPAPKGGGIIKRDNWKLFPPDGREDQWLNMEGRLKFPSFEYILASVDTAYTADKENDYSACTVWGVWRDEKIPKLMLVEAWAERLLFHDLVQKIIETARRRKIDCLLVEGKASGMSVYQEIKRLCSPEDFSVYSINPVGDKVTRVHTVQPLFEGGIIYAPDRQYADKVITQFEQFPKGKNDDLVDSSTQGLFYMRKIGLAKLSQETTRETAPLPYVSKEKLYDV